MSSPFPISELQKIRESFARASRQYPFLSQHTALTHHCVCDRGKTATFHCKEALEFGTKLVGGVSPKKAGTTHLGQPVFGTVMQVCTPPSRTRASAQE